MILSIILEGNTIYGNQANPQEEPFVNQRYWMDYRKDKDKNTTS